MTEASQPLFLFGAGFSGLALAQLWGGKVIATSRRMEQVAQLYERGIDPVWIGSESVMEAQPFGSAAISVATKGAHIVISAAPGEKGCPALPWLSEHVGEAASLTYLSTTGVYGDLEGGWAMEWSPVNPGSERAERRVEAEIAWRRLRPDVRIVRLPGIYGPGRSPLDRIREGRTGRVIKPGQVFSRVHVDDIASGLKALLQSGETGVYHLCDEEAAPPQDVTTYAADLLGVDLPPPVDLEGAELSDMARSFYAECKRVSNARVKAATGWRPSYRTYREGLRALYERGH